jgi:hypothetical protein
MSRGREPDEQPFEETMEICVGVDSIQFPRFSKPAIRGSFSLNAERAYVEGPRALQFLQLPPQGDVNFDLDAMTRRAKEDPTTPPPPDMHQQTNELVHLLEWIRRHEESFLKRWVIWVRV